MKTLGIKGEQMKGDERNAWRMTADAINSAHCAGPMVFSKRRHIGCRKHTRRAHRAM